MDQKPIMIFQIECDWEGTSDMALGNGGHVTIIPFGGKVESKLFSGTILPGAADVQVTNAAGVKHMCAKYMFQGKDAKGNDCHLYVENNGYFPDGKIGDPFDAVPVFKTDSKELESYLMADHFRAKGYGKEKGPDIYIYDVSHEPEDGSTVDHP